ncbi:MAG: protein kinase [Gemmataceae bacterium]
MPDLPPTNPARSTDPDEPDRTGSYEGSVTPAGFSHLDDLQPGTVIAGRYKLLEAIGEGGMGSVWMARQTEPVKRNVAVKLIRAGMDSKSVLARFEAERQALSMMDHPNIARVFDVGTTPSGRPFFVMELVKGTPITEFCDQRKFTPRQRLELFVPVCLAIQHAHQKGIIHRDIKPSNVLVALHDDKPVPKVIDFGVAKATGTPLTEKTLHTGFEQVVGTPAYMSPEQATFNQLDIDTRSDVYSLGVLLYELLTGTTPIERERFKKAALIEMLRVVREEEPPRPSARLSSTQTKATISEQRGSEPARLTKELRAELDWVVMKSLEKDRTRRYATAVNFADDVQRYLAGEPVLAHPPSAGYRMRKFVRRHTAAVAASTVVVLAAAIGSVGLAFGLIERAEREAERARVQQEQQEADYRLQLDEERRNKEDRQRRIRNVDALQMLLERSEEALRSDDAASALLILDQAARRESEVADPVLRERLERGRGDLALLLELDRINGLLWTPIDGRFTPRSQVVAQWRGAFDRWGLKPDANSPRDAAARLEASPVRDQALAALDLWLLFQPEPGLRDLLGAADHDEFRDAVRSAVAKDDLARLAERVDALNQPPRFAIRLGWSSAIPELRRKLIISAAVEKQPSDFGLLMNRASLSYFHDPGQLAEREMWYRAALAMRPRSSTARLGLVETLIGRGTDFDGAAIHAREVVRLDPPYRWGRIQLATALGARGDLAEAIDILEDLLRSDPEDTSASTQLAGFYSKAGNKEKAEARWRDVIRRDPKGYVARNNLAYHLLLDRGELDEAKKLFEESLQIEPRFVTPKFHIMTVDRYRANLKRLPDVAEGRSRPMDGELGEFVEVSERPFVRQYVLAVQLYSRQMKRQPVERAALWPPDDVLHNAARCAILAADGQDIQMTEFGMEEWGHLLDRAHAWLQRDLTLLTPLAQELDKRQLLAARLRSWQRDPDFVSIRDPERLARMTAWERARWDQFWLDVGHLLAVATDHRPLATAPRPQ